MEALEHSRAVHFRGVLERDRVVATETALRDLMEDLDHHRDLDDARGRELRVGVDEDGLARGQVLRRYAHRSPQRAHGLFHARLQGGRGERRRGQEDERENGGHRPVEGHGP